MFAPLLAAAAEEPTLSSSGHERSDGFKKAFEKLTAGKEPTEDRLILELPDVAENGNFVPLTITADSPMTEADHVTAIHLLSTANPQPYVATFRLSPKNAKASVQTRMRLAKTQDVVALAELSSGEFFMTAFNVKVTLGGCSN